MKNDLWAYVSVDGRAFVEQKSLTGTGFLGTLRRGLRWCGGGACGVRGSREINADEAF